MGRFWAAVASALTALFLVAGTPSGAWAIDGQNAECLFAFPNQVDDPDHCKLTDGSSVAEASVQASPFVLLKSSASGSGANSSAFIGYDFNITGGNPGDVVDIAITTEMLTQLTGDGSSFAELFFQNSDIDGLTAVCSSTLATATACVDNSIFDGTLNYDGTQGDLQHLQMFISATSGTAGSGFASADPLITVTGITDPNVVYGVQIIGGAGNGVPTAGVPEPAGWMLMLLGLGGLGALLRRGRGRAAAAVAAATA